MPHIVIPAIGDRDKYDLRQNSSALFPSESYINFLNQADIQKNISAEVQYFEFSGAVYDLFANTGDVRFCLPYFLQTRFKVNLQRLEIQIARTWLPELGVLANSGLKILIWVRADTNITLRILPLHLIGW